MERSELNHLLGLLVGSSIIAQSYNDKLARTGLTEKKKQEYEQKQAEYDLQSYEARQKIMKAFDSRNRKKNGKTEA